MVSMFQEILGSSIDTKMLTTHLQREKQMLQNLLDHLLIHYGTSLHFFGYKKGLKKSNFTKNYNLFIIVFLLSRLYSTTT